MRVTPHGQFPLDVAKTEMQARGSTVAATARRLIVAEAAPLRRIYRGLSPAIAEHMLNRSFLFGVGAVIKRQVPREWPEPVRDAASGAGAALAKTFILHPLDTVKCRWQLGMPWSDLGGLYRGLGPAAFRSSFGMAVWLASRNHLERVLPDEGRFWSVTKHFAAGALSSALTDLCTFPFDTLKKSMQSGIGSADLGAEMRRMYRDGGIGRFYRGYAARFFMVSLNGALFNAAFVVLKRNLEPFMPLIAADLQCSASSQSARSR